MGKISVKQLSEHVWLMDDNREATGYIVVGREKCMVIDTMNGSEDELAIVRGITDLPVFVVNTHGHPDHVSGNQYFEEAYLHPADMNLVKTFITPEAAEKIPPFKPVKEGDVFDLGGLHVEVYDLPGHTPGGILLLLVEDRILFTGDGINHWLWMQLDHSLSLEELAVSMDRVAFLTERADRIAHGHAVDFDDISLYGNLRKGVQELLDQKDGEVTKADPDYEWFGGTDKRHPFDAEGSVICYRPDHIQKRVRGIQKWLSAITEKKAKRTE